MFFLQTPVLLYQKLFPEAIFQLKHPNQIALTFDDGPIPEVTEFILDVLKSYQIPATFFCVGHNIIKHKKIFDRILNDGHSVGNHTFSHINGWKCSLNRYLGDVNQFEKIYSTSFFRPPYGKIKKSQYNELLKRNYKIVFWSIISYDYHSKMTENKCKKLLENQTTGGQIVLFHDSIKSFRLISKILPQYIEFCHSLNLTFVPLKNSLL
ncbi:MAG: polysaccharide deacetylase [Bacteroidia bacterium]|nr:MAG: polysaccharide deacetylase [Bacteroidia bacterium]